MPLQERKHKGYQVCHLNIRSVLRHLDELTLSLSDNEILCLSETWLTNNVIDAMVDLPTYKFVRQDRQSLVSKRGGGLLMYYKTPIAPFITLQPALNSTDSNLEQLWIKIEKPGNKRLYIATIYRPPSGKVNEFLETLKYSISTALTQHQNRPDIIVIGDFNIDYSKLRHPDRRALKAMVDDLDLIQIIKTPTRVTNQCKSVIDLILTNIDDNNIMASGVRNVTISDHLPIYMNIKKPKSKHQFITTRSRSYKLYSYINLSNFLLDNPEWRLFWLRNNTIDSCWDIMVGIIISSLNKFCPIKKVVKRSDQPPWMDKELITSISLKHALHKKARTSDKDTTSWENFKSQQKIVARLLVQKRRDYIIHTLNDNRDDPKKFWKEINKNLKFGKQKAGMTLIHVKKNEKSL